MWFRKLAKIRSHYSWLVFESWNEFSINNNLAILIQKFALIVVQQNAAKMIYKLNKKESKTSLKTRSQAGMKKVSSV